VFLAMLLQQRLWWLLLNNRLLDLRQLHNMLYNTQSNNHLASMHGIRGTVWQQESRNRELSKRRVWSNCLCNNAYHPMPLITGP